MADLSYLNEQLSRAVGELATDAGPLPDRLNAACYDLVQGVQHIDALPNDWANRFRELWANLTTDGNYAATIATLSPAQGTNYAREILEIAAAAAAVAAEQRAGSTPGK
jgi:hypothetical protein